MQNEAKVEEARRSQKVVKVSFFLQIYKPIEIEMRGPYPNQQNSGKDSSPKKANQQQKQHILGQTAAKWMDGIF